MADAKQGKPPMEDFYNGASQSRVVLAKPRLGGFGASGFGSGSSKSCNPFGSVLRPSTLKPGSNPFLKVAEKGEGEKEKEEKVEGEEQKKDSKEGEEAPKFVPLGSANVTARTSNPVTAPTQATSSSSAGFVFGQNLSERVVIQESVSNGEAPAAVDHANTNGTSGLLFTSAAATVKDTQEEGAPSDGVSLAAAAAEYERCHARPPPPAASYSLTGEEGEVNVLQISCRLFAWEAGSWRERGRGVLRLNDAAPDSNTTAARLVVRVAGSLRVVLNTKLWADMVVQKAGTKSLRITAADAQNQVKLFLIMGAPSDIIQLYRALTSRVALSKKSNPCPQNAPSQTAAERLEAATDDNEFIDKTDKDIEDIDEDTVEDTTKDIGEDTTKDTGEDTSKGIAEDTMKDLSEDKTKDATTDVAKDATTNIAEDAATDKAEDATTDITTEGIDQDITEDMPEESTKNIVEGTTKDIAQDIAEEIEEDSTKDIAEELTTDIAEESTKDIDEESTKDIAEESTTDIVEDSTTDIAEESTKDIAEDTTSDIAEESTKDIMEEETTDIAEESTTDVGEESTKNIVEDTTKDIAEESTKDIAEDTTTDITENATTDIAQDITEDIAEDTSNNITKDTDIPLTNEAKEIPPTSEVTDIPPENKATIDQTASIENQKEETEAKTLKRKEPTDDETETSPKRQCPDSTQ